jgi:hypothetical protein
MFMCNVWLWCHFITHLFMWHVWLWLSWCICSCDMCDCDCHDAFVHVTYVTAMSWPFVHVTCVTVMTYLFRWHVWLQCHDAFVHVNFNDLSLLQSCQWNGLVRFYFLILKFYNVACPESLFHIVFHQTTKINENNLISGRL